MKIFSNTVIFFINLYQKIFSPFLGNRCRFYPSCSQYAKETFQVFPFFKACYKSAYRILRCGPWSKGGVDFVIKDENKNLYNKGE